MGLRDLIFGREEDNANPPESEENVVFGEAEDEYNAGIEAPRAKTPAPPKPMQEEPQAPVVAASSAELDAELKVLKDLMQQEKKEKGLGLEYYGFLKALGEEEDADAYQRTLRTLNAVREQFSVGSALTWKVLIDSAKSSMSWLSSHSQQKVAKLQADRQTANANFTLHIQKTISIIEENEAKILSLQKEIEAQKLAQQAAKDAKNNAELDFEKKKAIIDNASVHVANDIANDIARFQRES